MTTRAVDVCIDGEGAAVAVGRLYLRQRPGRGASASFGYAESWLARPGAYAIDPQLPLASGTFHTGPEQELFRALSDSAPDRWGVELARRAERRRAHAAAETPRSLGEADLLLAVRDVLRQGALRLRDPESGVFLADDHDGVPPLVELGRLLSASENLERDADTDDDLRLLLEAGSSLGGARPKAHVRDGGRVLIAKLPRVTGDRWQVTAWERVALELAARAGIRVAPARLERVGGRPVLLVERFDRVPSGGRIGYVSALTMLEARDGDRRSYLDLADVIERTSPAATDDLRELWRRVAFSILISNTDDHLRNHGFLRAGSGWVLAPAFDLNPDPDSAGRLSTAIEDARDRRADIAALVKVAPYFRVADVGGELRRLLDATAGWRACADRHGAGAEAARLAPAFEHLERDAAERLAAA